MDAIANLLSNVGLRPWDLAFFGAWAAGAGLCATFGLEKAYKALFGLAMGCVLYVAATWFLASLASLPMSAESRGFFSSNQGILLHAAWLGIWLAPVLAVFSPSLAAPQRVRGAAGLVLRVALVPALFVASLGAVLVLSAERTFPFAFDNLPSRFPGLVQSLRAGSSLYGWLQAYGVPAVAVSILAGTYAMFLSPLASRIADRLDSARLPSFFRDAQASRAAEDPGPHGPPGHPEHAGH